MIRIVAAVEADIHRILEIEREAITPPWSREALFSEINREDSFFAVARGEHEPGNSEFGIRNSEFRIRGSESRVQCTESGVQCVEQMLGCADQPDAVIHGFVILRRIGDDGELLQIAVDRVARRHGIADLLMGAALRYVEDNALDAVFLEVRSSNGAAIPLYKKHGFEFMHLRKDYYCEPVEDAVIMVRKHRNIFQFKL